MRALFALSSEVTSSHIFISLRHVLYLSLSNAVGGKYLEAIVSFSATTIIKNKKLTLPNSAYGDASLHPSFLHFHKNQ